MSTEQQRSGGSLAEVAGLFFKLGVIGFGGPTAHIALMEDEAVRRRKWLDRQHFLDALAATNLIPGPNSTEMAIHLGYLRAGRLGGIISGLAFILPAFVMLLALSWAYRSYGTIPEVGAVFAGLKPVVVAIIVIAAYRLAVTGITDWRLLLIGLAFMALTLAFRGGELVALLAAGLLGIWLYGPPGGRFPWFPRSPAAAAGLLQLQAPATTWTPNLSALPAQIWVL
ncbi:MAG: chromate transporter, partial [Chloroflexota bacterium]|nr:chromate transporter [Chloroflexota bacterium]